MSWVSGEGDVMGEWGGALTSKSEVQTTEVN